MWMAVGRARRAGAACEPHEEAPGAVRLDLLLQQRLVMTLWRWAEADGVCVRRALSYAAHLITNLKV